MSPQDEREAAPFVCRHGDERCQEDPCPWGIARVLCNAPAKDPIRLLPDTKGEGLDGGGG